MNSIDKNIKSVLKIKRNLKKYLDESVSKNKRIYIGMIQNRLFHEGLDGNLDALGPYAPSKRAIKESKGINPDIVTLYEKGNFYSGMFLTSKSGSVNISSKDDKTQEILSLFSGYDIFGLTEEEQETIMKRYIDLDIQKKINNILEK